MGRSLRHRSPDRPPGRSSWRLPLAASAVTALLATGVGSAIGGVSGPTDNYVAGVTYSTASSSVDATDSKSVTVDCPAGTNALGGGGDIDDGPAAGNESENVALRTTQPAPNTAGAGAGTGWTAIASEADQVTNAWGLDAWAVCAATDATDPSGGGPPECTGSGDGIGDGNTTTFTGCLTAPGFTTGFVEAFYSEGVDIFPSAGEIRFRHTGGVVSATQTAGAPDCQDLGFGSGEPGARFFQLENATAVCRWDLVASAAGDLRVDTRDCCIPGDKWGVRITPD